MFSKKVSILWDIRYKAFEIGWILVIFKKFFSVASYVILGSLIPGVYI